MKLGIADTSARVEDVEAGCAAALSVTVMRAVPDRVSSSAMVVAEKLGVAVVPLTIEIPEPPESQVVAYVYGAVPPEAVTVGAFVVTVASGPVALAVPG